VTDVRTAATFDYAAGEIPENITVNPDGSVTLSMLGRAGSGRTGFLSG
jgi:hypothetical protein